MSYKITMKKQTLIEYLKVIKPIEEINENDSFNDVFKQVTGKSYENYLKKLRKILKLKNDPEALVLIGKQV